MFRKSHRSKQLILLVLFGLVTLQHCPTQPDNQDNDGPDTTSHTFTWEIDTLGDAGHGSHYLLDVAIGNNKNIWVVGLIRTDEYDSATGMEYTEYNAARWNGRGWQFIRIAPAGYYGSITAVYAFTSDDIWFGKYGLAFHFNGTNFIRYDPSNSSFPGMPSINAIWGRAPDDVYFGGNDGSIVHYNGATFTEVPTNTTLPIQDIWGTGSSAASRGKVLALASDKYQQQGVEIFQVTSHGVTLLPHTGLSWSMSSLWFQAGTPYYASGAGLYTIPDLPGDSLWHRAQGDTLTGNYLHHLRGTAANNIIAVGAFGTILHFNGDSWSAVAQLPANLRLLRVAVRGRMVAACGEMAGRAVVVRGERLEK